jgi:dTDP-4-dehydrorhamnose reductase
MRWLHEVWQVGLRARRDGIDVRAVTTWALLGSYDWNSLVTRETDHYEPGAFDVRSPVPRATALAGMVRALANDGRFEHPVLATPGWWRRGGATLGARRAAADGERSIVIIESDGTMARTLADACECRGLAHASLDYAELDGEPGESIEHMLETHRPWAVIATADCSDALAEGCARLGILFVRCSSHAGDANATLDLLLDDASDHTAQNALSGAGA